ncbi:MAG TPA: hypothetical protein VGK39_06840 [Cyclobacteriaceae bacterium]
MFISLTMLVSCSESEPSAEEKVTAVLIKGDGTWEPAVAGNAIVLDGIDVEEDLFPGFTIRFTKDKIFTTGTSPVWLREDTWRFKEGSKASVIIRGMDDKEITIQEISATQLKFSLEWDQTTYGGRVSSLPGLYEFILDK